MLNGAREKGKLRTVLRGRRRYDDGSHDHARTILEVCGLTWQDINLDGQYLTVRRSILYNGARHKIEIGSTKRSKIRTVDFCDTLPAILRAAKSVLIKNRFRYGALYNLNYYKEVKEKAVLTTRSTRCLRRRKGLTDTGKYRFCGRTGRLKRRTR